jgi:hypothetical protein
LTYKEDQEIELFEWCGLAVQSTSQLANELASYKARFKEQQGTISRLNAQLEDLVAAKASHETELLEKFRDLLNEKKAKIRDQQRLLATAKVDPKKLAEVQNSRSSSRKTSAGPSRSGKRKKNGLKAQEDEESDQEFEMMDVDVDQVPNDSDQEAVETPEEDETETADEDEEDIVPQVKPPAANTRRGNGKAVAKNTTKDKSSDGKGTKTPNTEDDPPKTPPRRELPFAKKNQPQAKPAVQDDDETASEDDEL